MRQTLFANSTVAVIRATLTCAVAVLPLLTGCDTAQSGPPTSPDALPAAVLTSPEDAARSAIATIKSELAAIAAHDKAAIDRAHDQLLRISSPEKIKAKWPKSRVGQATLDAAVAKVTHMWGLVVGYYINDLSLDRMRREFESDSVVRIVIPAKGSGRETLIRVECVLEGAEWHVDKVDYASRPAASQPASRKAD